MKFMPLLAIGLLLSLTTQAQKDPVARKVLDAMSLKYKKISAFVAEFSYVMRDDSENIDEGFKGNIQVKGEKYKLKMEGQEITFDGKDVYTYFQDDHEMTISEYNQDSEEITISNIFNIYKTGFKYVANASLTNAATQVIDLVPEDRDKDYFKIRMSISQKGYNLKKFMIFDKSGSRYIYTILGFQEKNNTTDAIFQFDQSKYPNTEIIDLR